MQQLRPPLAEGSGGLSEAGEPQGKAWRVNSGRQLHMEGTFSEPKQLPRLGHAFTDMIQRVRDGDDGLVNPSRADTEDSQLGDECQDLAAALNRLFADHRIAVMEGIAHRLRAAGPALVDAVKLELDAQAASIEAQNLGVGASRLEGGASAGGNSPLWRRTRFRLETLSLAAGALSPVRKVREALAGSD